MVPMTSKTMTTTAGIKTGTSIVELACLRFSKDISISFFSS
jgi:hypothetical protein